MVGIDFFSGTLKELLAWLKDNLLKERPELFLCGESVYVKFFFVFTFIHTIIVCRRPGILVLVNDTDWELLVSLCNLLPDFSCYIYLGCPKVNFRRIPNKINEGS